MNYQTVKSLIDIVFAAFSLLLLSPLLLVVALLIYLFLGPPVLFCQSRAGYLGQSFLLVKFRSMTSSTDSSGNLLPDSQRLTSFGLFLRHTSIDELPSLVNIFLGHMSFVGPRPLLVEYLPLYTPHQFRRHLVKPGLTGLAQVNGRNALTWHDKFSYDLYYIRRQSLMLDISILLRTPLKVLLATGVSASSHSTSPPFTGK